MRTSIFALNLMAFFALTAPAVAQQVSFTPRVSYYFDNDPQRQSGTDLSGSSAKADENEANEYFQSVYGPTASYRITSNAAASSSNQTKFVLYGGTLAFNWPGSESTQIAVTGLYGTASAETKTVLLTEARLIIPGAEATDIYAGTQQLNNDSKRLDIEITLQKRLNETLSLIGGLRLEQVDNELLGVGNIAGSANITNLINAPFNAQFGLPPSYALVRTNVQQHASADSKIYSARLGAAAYAQTSDHHLFYVNGLLQVSHSPAVNTTIITSSTAPSFEPTTEINVSTAETSLGPDISVGYMYRFNERAGIDARYRAIFYFPVGGNSSFADPRVNHGATIGVTMWFGR